MRFESARFLWSREKVRERNCYWGSQLKLSFLEAELRRYSASPHVPTVRP